MTHANIRTVGICLAAIAALALVRSAAAQSVPVASSEEQARALAKGNESFALNLYANLAQQKGNLFFSPYSVSAAMTMTYLGATGPTAEEMQVALGIPTAPTPTTGGSSAPWPATELAGVYKSLQDRYLSASRSGEPKPDEWRFQLHVANALWPGKDVGLRTPYATLISEDFGGKAQELDYSNPDAARNIINHWVEDQTQQKIKELIGPNVLGRDTRLVLTNAVYFKAGWREPFKPQATRKETFHADGKDVQADMMDQTKDFRYGELKVMGKDFQALELPYRGDGGGNCSMLILLPREAKALEAVEKNMRRTPAGSQPTIDVDAIDKSLASAEVHVKLPRFKMTSQFELAEQLKAMGITSAFDRKLANFSGMFENPDGTFITNVIHKAFVDVREEGTEAAAATAVAMVGVAFRQSQPREFIADHPFLFFIRDNNSGMILFMGRLADPS